MEVINDLVGYKNMKIYQNTDWFSFSLDSILLPNFVTINPSIKNIVDLGTGNAPIPLILSTKTKAHIIGIEIQKDVFELAQKSINYNNLAAQIDLFNINMKDVSTIIEGETIDVVTCNPPYFKYLEQSNTNDNIHKTIARHEIEIKLEDIIRISYYLLKNNGIFAMVHRTDRLIEIISLLNKSNFEVKKLRFVYPKVDSESNMILIEAKKNGGVGLKVMPPLYTHYDDGKYTSEILEMFE